MKTIGERAFDYVEAKAKARKEVDKYLYPYIESTESDYLSLLEGYVAGAKEQQKIDDANMQERFEKVLNGQKLDLIDKACDLLRTLGVFEWMANESSEGFSANVYELQFRTCML
ncbi:MAG: hypothetical protein ACI4N3_01130 [Alphaproteobacteria bacterium]